MGEVGLKGRVRDRACRFASDVCPPHPHPDPLPTGEGQGVCEDRLQVAAGPRNV